MNDHPNSYIIFDLETTGLSTKNDRIIEISALKVTAGKVVDEFSTLVDPEMPIPEMAEDITGITTAMVSGAPKVAEALTGFLEFVGDMELVGHNIKRFDLKFITRDAEELLNRTIDNHCTDTLMMAKRWLPELDAYSLGDLALYYDIPYEGAHRALNDCRINQKVYECLLKESQDPSEAAKGMKVCPLCGCLMKQRTGKFGEFWGCTGYPDCKYTENIASAPDPERAREDKALPLDTEEAKKFAESMKWTFAVTYAESAPHEYLVKAKLTEEDKILFERFVQTIKRDAVVGYFYGHKNNYLILGDHYYWFMGQLPGKAVDLINRTTTDYLEYRDGAYCYKGK
ncbi:MAG: topoisomerase DNA-binding C4 zinc finger domain-containing protein [Clostridiales bacterium]|nr:topoisomerase DNA-binding C4 zinc finger domain-containing protein [Clostridiales bacterium]